MAKSKLRPNRTKYYRKTKNEWLFDKKSKLLLVIFAVVLTVVAIIGLVGAITKYIKLLSK